MNGASRPAYSPNKRANRNAPIAMTTDHQWEPFSVYSLPDAFDDLRRELAGGQHLLVGLHPIENELTPDEVNSVTSLRTSSFST